VRVASTAMVELANRVMPPVRVVVAALEIRSWP